MSSRLTDVPSLAAALPQVQVEWAIAPPATLPQGQEGETQHAVPQQVREHVRLCLACAAARATPAPARGEHAEGLAERLVSDPLPSRRGATGSSTGRG